MKIAQKNKPIKLSLATRLRGAKQRYLAFEINYFQDEDGHFTAEVPAIHGCVAWGKTLRETYKNAVKAIESCLEARETQSRVWKKALMEAKLNLNEIRGKKASESQAIDDVDESTIKTSGEKTGRQIALGLRYAVLTRDNFKCVKCGISPAHDPSCKLHVDHAVPFSKGGETTLENLQTLCEECNLGKGNRYSE